jgi:hypothetical protein
MTSISSHNLLGANRSYDPGSSSHDLCKLDVLVCLMLAKNIDIYLPQESWLLDDWITTYMELQSSIRALRNISAIADPAAGVAIMLGPCAQHA